MENFSNKSFYKKSIALFFAFLILFSSFTVYADKEHFDNWQAVGQRMSECFDGALEAVNNDDYKAAYDKMNDAYFDYYEVQGFEATVMNSISRSRVKHIEALFREIKFSLNGTFDDVPKEEIILKIEALRVKVYRDALVLDGIYDDESLDYVGEAVYGDVEEIPERWMTEEEAALEAEAKGKEVTASETTEKDEKTDAPVIKEVSEEEKNQKTFWTMFILLVREGLEAILVVVAIIAYLVKTGNKHMCKSVYRGVLYAVVCSIILALVIDFAVENSGEARELIEGWTMFLAVIILFYVSNWIISKADAEKWDAYIKDKVADSIDRKSKNTLVFAAFLAVFREGAELILFYKAAFIAGQYNSTYVLYGILAGTALLVVVYILFRYTTVKLPLKPFFIFTSVLLYLMCISFMGKGVIELTEANVILGSTLIEPIRNFEIPLLNIYPRAEILIPQLMLVIASVWIMLKNLGGKKKEKVAVEKPANIEKTEE